MGWWKKRGKWISLPVITIPLFTSVAFITQGLGQNEPSFPFPPASARLSAFCLPVSEMTDGLTLGPKQRWQLLLRHPRRSQASSAQTVQQLLPLFGQHLQGPDTTTHRAENKGQRQQSVQPPLSFRRDSCLSLASGCTPVKTDCWEVTGLVHAAMPAHHRFCHTVTLAGIECLAALKISAIAVCWAAKPGCTHADTGRAGEVRLSEVSPLLLARQCLFFLVQQLSCL